MALNMADRPDFSVWRTVSCLPIAPISRWRLTVDSTISGSSPSSRSVAATFHFGSAPFAVAGHALEIVVSDLLPIERRIIVLQRDGDFLQHSGAGGGEEAFECERFHAFDHDAADHLDRGRRSDLWPTTENCMSNSAAEVKCFQRADRRATGACDAEQDRSPR